jgi:hypothetical protein
MAKRRQRLSQAMVRSTIHRLGKTAKPLAVWHRTSAGMDAGQTIWPPTRTVAIWVNPRPLFPRS